MKKQLSPEIGTEELPEQPVPAEADSLFLEEWRTQMLQEALDRLRHQVKPEKSFEFQRGDIHFFNTAFCSGNPRMCIRKNRDMIQIYPNGYGVGNPSISIRLRREASAWDVIELFLFYCVIGMR